MTYEQFRDKYNNKYVNYDGSYGSQCWDLAQQYFVECLGLPENILGGCGLVSNMLKEPKISLLLQYFDEVPLDNMIAGDVIIFERGHIAIFDSWNGRTNLYFTQNTGTADNPQGAAHIGQCKSGASRAFRLKKKEEPRETPAEAIPEPTGNKKTKVGETIKKCSLTDYEGVKHVSYLGEFKIIDECDLGYIVLYPKPVIAIIEKENIK